MSRTVAAFAFLIVLGTTGEGLRAQQQTSPRDLWPQAATAAREGDFETATKKKGELLTAARTYGIRTFPSYAVGASALARTAVTVDPPLSEWAAKAAQELDGSSPAVAFSEADRIAQTRGWSAAVPVALRGLGLVFSNYRTNVLSRSDLVIVASIALAVTAFLLALALFIRYGRAIAHDFREILGTRLRGGSVSVLAFALMFLPLFLWLGPQWLLFYWLALAFGYSGWAERIAIVVILLLVALLPLAIDASAHAIAGVDSPVVVAAVAGVDQAYQPEALRRMQELIAVVPDDPILHVLLGNLVSFEGLDDQAAFHFRRAVELRPGYAGARVNRGNLFFLDNEFQAAINEYQLAEQADPELAMAFYNHSVAAGELYRFDLQKEMLERARAADRSLVERTTRNPPPQKIVMYKPPIDEAWEVSERVSRVAAARALFGNYSTFDPVNSASNPITIGALATLLLAGLLFFFRRSSGYANACIKCGRTFCPRCKSARESTTYCTQCIHIYLKRDGVSLDTKRQKLEEVGSYQSGLTLRNRLFATFLPGSAQVLEGRVLNGALGAFLFALFVATALLTGRLAPALGPTAEVGQMLVRSTAVALAVLLWIFFSLPVYRRRSAS